VVGGFGGWGGGGGGRGGIEPFFATLAQNGLTQCDQPGKNPSKFSTIDGNRTRAMEKTHSEIILPLSDDD